jgi:hypothetical protein
MSDVDLDSSNNNGASGPCVPHGRGNFVSGCAAAIRADVPD